MLTLAATNAPSTAIERLAALAGSQQRRRRVARVIDLGNGIGVVTLLLFLVDAAWPMPVWGRWIAGGVMLLAGLGGVGWAVVRRGRDDAIAPTARSIERAHGLSTTPLIAAVQLADGAAAARTGGSGDAIRRVLIARVQRRAETVLTSLTPVQPGHRGPVLRAAGRLWAGGVLWAIVGLIQPGVLSAGAARFGLPGGADRPFSLTRLSVTAEPERVRPGDDVRLMAVATGRLPDDARLVPVDPGDHDGEPRAMTRQATGRFSATLYNVREPMRFRVEAGTARSAVIAIVPRAAVQPEGDDAKITGEAKAGAEAKAKGRAARRENWATQPAASALNAREIARRLRSVAQALASLAARASSMPSAGDASGRARRDHDQTLARQAEALAERMRALRSELRRGKQRAVDRALLDRTTRALKKANLTRIVGDAAGAGSTRGADDASAERSAHARRIGKRAGRSADRMNELASAWREAGLSGRAARGDAGNRDASRSERAAATGRHIESMRQGEPRALPGQYQWRDVPTRYRALVGDYFDRLSTDEPVLQERDER